MALLAGTAGPRWRGRAGGEGLGVEFEEPVTSLWVVDQSRGPRQFYAAFTERGGQVIDAAPILSWTKGKPLLTILCQ